MTPRINYFKKNVRYSLRQVGINITLMEVSRYAVGRVKLVRRKLMEVRTELCLCHYLCELKTAKVTQRQLI